MKEKYSVLYVISHFNISPRCEKIKQFFICIDIVFKGFKLSHFKYFGWCLFYNFVLLNFILDWDLFIFNEAFEMKCLFCTNLTIMRFSLFDKTFPMSLILSELLITLSATKPDTSSNLNNFSWLIIQRPRPILLFSSLPLAGVVLLYSGSAVMNPITFLRKYAATANTGVDTIRRICGRPTLQGRIIIGTNCVGWGYVTAQGFFSGQRELTAKPHGSRKGQVSLFVCNPSHKSPGDICSWRGEFGVGIWRRRKKKGWNCTQKKSLG